MENKETKYFIMTSEQKNTLEDIFRCLGVEFEDVLEIGNLRSIKKRIEKLEKNATENETRLIQLNNRLATIELSLHNFDAQQLQEALYGNDEEN